MQKKHLSKILKQVALTDCVRIQDGGYLLKRARGRLLGCWPCDGCKGSFTLSKTNEPT